jgi:hypothetical protein
VTDVYPTIDGLDSTLIKIGDFIETTSTILQLGPRTVVIIIVVCLPIALLAYLVFFLRGNGDQATFVGRIIKVFTSGASFVTSLALFLPILARACWAAKDISDDVLKNIGVKMESCIRTCKPGFDLIRHNTIPYSSPLGIAVFSLTIAAGIWFISAISDAFKK